MEVPQVSLTLFFNDRERPVLQSIRFMPGPEPRAADELQDRDLPKAVAVALLLFRIHAASWEPTAFRIHAAKGDGGFVRSIRNAKSDSQSKSSIHALARGAFLRLFRSRGSQERCYIEIDLTHLKPSAVEIVLDRQVVDHPETLKQMTALIADRKGWNLDDYSVEAIPQTKPVPDATSTASAATLDNAALIAIREAVRNFCQAVYTSICRCVTFDPRPNLKIFGKLTVRLTATHLSRTKNSRIGGSPSGLHALFFRTRVMGAIGIWPLSARYAELFTNGHIKEAQLNGRAMRPFMNSPTRFWYISGIVLHSELRGGRAIKILLSRGIGCWLASARIDFPCELLALAYSEQGRALLEGFDFFKLQNARAMPDGVPLFALQVSDKKQLLSSLNSRGVDPCPPAAAPSN